jgi:mannose-6-phosphate isomerase-like protein (cupin superfamily)
MEDNIMTNILYGDLNKLTLENNNYRKVIATTKHQQLVLMSIKPKEEIGLEIHKNTTQFIKIEKGSCIAIIGKEEIKIKKEGYIVILPNTQHNIINIGRSDLKLYTIYSPPHHKPNTIQKLKQN